MVCAQAMKLLLVEDNQVLAAGVMALLRDEGHEVVLIERGRQVMAMIRQFKPDAVVLDVTLPDIDGIQVSKFIRRDHARLPIVFATGHDRDHSRLSEAISDNKMSMLRKPYEIAALLGELSRLMRVV